MVGEASVVAFAGMDGAKTPEGEERQSTAVACALPAGSAVALTVADATTARPSIGSSAAPASDAEGASATPRSRWPSPPSDDCPAREAAMPTCEVTTVAAASPGSRGAANAPARDWAALSMLLATSASAVLDSRRTGAAPSLLPGGEARAASACASDDTDAARASATEGATAVPPRTTSRRMAEIVSTAADDAESAASLSCSGAGATTTCMHATATARPRGLRAGEPPRDMAPTARAKAPASSSLALQSAAASTQPVELSAAACGGRLEEIKAIDASAASGSVAMVACTLSRRFTARDARSAPSMPESMTTTSAAT
mmetsp:Transcript_4317/g.12477  ORF Transcript_4317/g.12477 Transcript_4317/m.12477 type:complete len:316 (+) Transcript_4317:2492-3439(+)